MKVVEVPQPGGPEALVLAERPVPEPGSGEVLIKVAAAGLNRADTLQRRGFYPSPAGVPSYPGLEVSGTIAALGDGVSEFKVGDAVCALLAGGGYAEYCRVDAGQVLPIPGSLDMIEAASLPEAMFTVWSNVFGFGRLQPGETLLVHGGSSGIGVAAIQLAAVLGHTVFTTAGSDDKCRFCESLGARRAIDYKTEDFVAEIAKATDGRGVNVVLDMVGGSYVARNLQVLAPAGRLVMIATQGGAKGEIDVLRIMQQRLVITGSTLRPRSAQFKRSIRDQLLQRVWPLLTQGRIRPVVDSVFALAEAGKAHARMEGGEHKGKIILTVI
jgi:putative PIG3 family NAD(P)H quinone oxidoreductase